ncbi:ABC transporter permease [Danxiaibacter flavus]|uniref:ABC transporter permease n=1 Tax=Danxiaibacter flavus TaxID=3049108 RepID=A0ABV3Z7Y2_9BACT|nr:ABC transporter permease [Chitinophagaceae bacterium DXS]
MLKNYILVALRNLKRNKVFSLINILGLALGMTCSLLILLWVKDERAKDAFHANNKRLYNIYERQYYDNRIEAGFFTPGMLGEEMKKVIPEVEAAIGFGWQEELTFQVGDKILKEKGTHAGKDFFKMFSFPLLKGSPEKALSTPESIAISETMAKHFFGKAEDAIGKTIRVEDSKDLIVSGVYADMGNNSSFKGDYIINWDYFLVRNDWAKDWGNNGPHTTIMLRANANPELVRKKIVKFLDNYNKDQSAAFRIELGMQPYSDMYLKGNFKSGKEDGGRIEYVRLFTLIAIFILLIACINFMNLTTARSVKRAKEIGIRKVVGAMRGALIRQFLGEAVLLAFIAVIIALLLSLLLMPAFNHLTGKEISLPVSDSSFWLQLLAITLITGFISGSYPALFLSSFSAIRVLKGTMKFTTSATLFRKGLVVFQFVLSILLIIGTIIVSRQVNYIYTKNIGFDRENLIYIPIEGELRTKYELFRNEAISLPGIKNISRISQAPTEIENNTGGVKWDGKDPNTLPMFSTAAIGYDFIKTCNIRLLEGRDYSRDFATDSTNYILNESAVAKIGYKNPIGKPLTLWDKKGTIVGVIKDFHFTSLHQKIEPLILRYGEKDSWGSILVRTEAGKTKDALASLQKVCTEINPRFPFSSFFADEEFQKLYTSESIINKLSLCFAFLAIFISCLGLLGLVMFTAEQRTKEIGIRKVLGASVGSLFTLLSKEFLWLVFIAMMIASPLAWYAMHNWLQTFAYQITISWWIFPLAAATAILIALLTVSFQAAKAALVNPTKSLRTE